jgi:type I restriction enzyme R subunit
MSDVGKAERVTQERVITLFRDELGYRYLGNWIDCDENTNIEEDLLRAHLTKCDYSLEQINRAIYILTTQANN